MSNSPQSLPSRSPDNCLGSHGFQFKFHGLGSHGFQGKLRGNQLSSTEYRGGFYRKLTPNKLPLRGGGNYKYVTEPLGGIRFILS